MRVEAILPLIYRWPDGEVRLKPGEAVDLPDDRAKRLLLKAGGRVREVVDLAPGTRIRFHSPLFDCVCTANVVMDAGESVFVTDHSIMGDATPCVIRRAWIVETAHDVDRGEAIDGRDIPEHGPKQEGSR